MSTISLLFLLVCACGVFSQSPRNVHSLALRFCSLLLCLLAGLAHFSLLRVSAVLFRCILSAVLLHRAGASTLVCTDGDEQVVLNLHANFRINGLPPITPINAAAAAESQDDTLGSGVFVSQLLWGSEESVDLIRRAAPEVIVSCDTIYLPEFHEALAVTLKDALCTQGMVTSAASDPSTSSSAAVSSSLPAAPAPAPTARRVAFFAQVNRNPATFASYLRTFAEHGLKMEPMRYHEEAAGAPATAQGHTDADGEIASSFLPCRFAYDRECLQMHRIMLDEPVSTKTES